MIPPPPIFPWVIPGSAVAPSPIEAGPGLVAALERSDWLRLAPAGATEWIHFIILAPGVSVLVNLSLGAGSAAEPASPRLLLLARTDRWWGDAEEYPRHLVDVRQGRVDVAFASNSVRLIPEGYRIRAALRDGSVKLDVVVRPLTLPLLALRLPLGRAGDLSWLAVPRLVARGAVEVDGRCYSLDGAPAYHDHNWGRFDWGADLGWEWAVILPDGAPSPWTVLVVRLGSRSRGRIHAEGIWLWRDGVLARSWRGEAVTWHSEGYRRVASLPTVPGAWASLAPGLATGIPGRLVAQGEAGGDHLRIELHPEDPLRIVAAQGDGHTLLHEASARACVSGQVAGVPVWMEGRGVLEVANG